MLLRILSNVDFGFRREGCRARTHRTWGMLGKENISLFSFCFRLELIICLDFRFSVGRGNRQLVGWCGEERRRKGDKARIERAREGRAWLIVCGLYSQKTGFVGELLLLILCFVVIKFIGL